MVFYHAPAKLVTAHRHQVTDNIGSSDGRNAACRCMRPGLPIAGFVDLRRLAEVGQYRRCRHALEKSNASAYHIDGSMPIM